MNHEGPRQLTQSHTRAADHVSTHMANIDIALLWRRRWQQVLGKALPPLRVVGKARAPPRLWVVGKATAPPRLRVVRKAPAPPWRRVVG